MDIHARFVLFEHFDKTLTRPLIYFASFLYNINNNIMHSMVSAVQTKITMHVSMAPVSITVSLMNCMHGVKVKCQPISVDEITETVTTFKQKKLKKHWNTIS